MNITIKVSGQIEEWVKNATDGCIISLGGVGILKKNEEFLMLESSYMKEDIILQIREVLESGKYPDEIMYKIRELIKQYSEKI